MRHLPAERLGPGLCGNLEEACRREWLVADGLGGYAMGTVAGLRTRRYHGLLVVAGAVPGARHLGLASLDPVLVLGGERVHLATHTWADGTVAPTGHRHLAEFRREAGLPVWTWSVGGTVLEATLAMGHGRAEVGVVHRLLDAPGPVELELQALCTWRDAHGERRGADPPEVELLPGRSGFCFEHAYRVEGPGFSPGGVWWRGVAYREEAARGLPETEDLWLAGAFSARLCPGETVEVLASAEGQVGPPQGKVTARRSAGAVRGGPAAGRGARPLVDAATSRAAALAGTADDAIGAALALAADQFIIAGDSGPAVVAGYPWFGEWSRDAMTAYEGLFLATGRASEGGALLRRLAATTSQGLLANTTDSGDPQYNTIDAALWFLHAADRHVASTGDLGLGEELLAAMLAVIEGYRQGTLFDIGVDEDGLVRGGTDGVALTWMDARVDGVAVTPRIGKPVEVNALWVNGLAATVALSSRLGQPQPELAGLERLARGAFRQRFPQRGADVRACAPGAGSSDGPPAPTLSLGLFDCIDGPAGDDPSLRPNQLLAVSLPYGPLAGPEGISVVAACGPLVTPLGLRSLSPADPRYRPVHRGSPAERDAAYHQGTVWPWWIGPYIDASRRVGIPAARLRPLLVALEAHLDEWGLGSVSETTDGAAPHAAAGCPFQAWSVAELLRARASLSPAADRGSTP